MAPKQLRSIAKLFGVFEPRGRGSISNEKLEAVRLRRRMR
jgi:hypothetical protein